jgi:hypothetical protein
MLVRQVFSVAGFSVRTGTDVTQKCYKTQWLQRLGPTRCPNWCYMSVPPYDIFRGHPNKDIMSVEALDSLALAKDRIAECARRNPGPYFIFSHRSSAVVVAPNSTQSFCVATCFLECPPRQVPLVSQGLRNCIGSLECTRKANSH